MPVQNMDISEGKQCETCTKLQCPRGLPGPRGIDKESGTDGFAGIPSKNMLFLIMFCTICALFFQPVLSSDWLFWRHQCVGAYGRLICNGRPSPNVPVAIYDQDKLDPDDLMTESRTDKNGYFLLYGCLYEHSDINPKLHVFHDCNNEPSNCSIDLKKDIPYSYVNNPVKKKRFRNFGAINITIKPPADDIKYSCFYNLYRF
ncbi:unnamed protein product [Thelazia callipaeda]|uniref:ZP domain-containing protein n=1 Tax=Thelazia callipaeda TaxID=103827 RepID=A0A0N5D8T4_THECL|nr:unnamed protein product [Thelazia callipaeda]